MIKLRCKKCGKALRDPESIARGMGPKCAGISGGRVRVKVRRLGGSPYNLGSSSSVQATLPIVDAAPEIQSTRELASCSREERRRLFKERRPFQCGFLLPERKPIIYTPTDDGSWKNNTSESVIPQDQLQSYLKRHQFI